MRAQVKRHNPPTSLNFSQPQDSITPWAKSFSFTRNLNVVTVCYTFREPLCVIAQFDDQGRTKTHTTNKYYPVLV